MDAYPNIATVAESGFTGFEASSWYGLVVKSGTPAQNVTILSNALMKIMKSPDVVEKLEKINSYSVGSTPEEFAHFMHQEQIKWSKVIREGNIQPD